MHIVMSFAADHPRLAQGALAVVIVTALCLVAMTHRPRRRDPQRLFTASERAESFRRAQGRCEYDSWMLLRCRRSAEHADHLHPWSRGGATTLRNCVAACARCNLRKSAKTLPRWRIHLIELRRGRYFPPGVDRRLGERYHAR